MKNLEVPRIRAGLVNWKKNDAIVKLIANTLESVGIEVVNFYFDETLPSQLDVLFIYGPYGSLVPIVTQLQSISEEERPILIFYHSEQFPNPAWPERLLYLGGVLRSGIERLFIEKLGFSRWSSFRLSNQGKRLRYYGDLYWLHQNALLSLLAIPSNITAEFFKERGFNVINSPGFGFPLTPEWGADLNLERDIRVLWLGKPGSKRRANNLQTVREELCVRGIEMMVVDGIEHPYVFGEGRTKLLNRTKIVLNLLRTEWEENAMRYYLAGLNRALIVTEPTLPHHPAFVPDVHLVESSIENMADSICHYLNHEEERRNITDAAYQLVTKQLTLANALQKILLAATSSQEI